MKNCPECWRKARQVAALNRGLAKLSKAIVDPIQGVDPVPALAIAASVLAVDHDISDGLLIERVARATSGRFNAAQVVQFAKAYRQSSIERFAESLREG